MWWEGAECPLWRIESSRQRNIVSNLYLLILIVPLSHPSMPYCEAVVLEGLRIFMSNTFGIPHRALADTHIKGYFIPKDTMVVGGFFGMNLDAKTFANPYKFDPEHFLKDGKVSIPDTYQPFGYGRRRCMGESLARSNLFLFVSTIFQNFNVAPPPGCPFPSDTPVDGATPSLQQYKVVITPR